MKQEMDTIDYNSLDISIEDFDALDGEHTFSKEYQKRKRKMCREYRKTVFAARRHYAKIAAAAFVLMIAVPAAVHAANDTDFFNRIWGSSGKKTIEAHEETIYDEEKGTSWTVTYPQKEYVDIASDKAEELIGGNVSKKKITKQLNDTTLTILSAVHDGQAAVVEFTLERDGGVNALNYDQLSNEDKGAGFSDEATFYFYFKNANENIFVDLEQSTDDILYCYAYMVLDTNISRLILETQEYSCTRKEIIEKSIENAKDTYADYTTKTQTLSIPFKEKVKTTDYINADGGIVRVSPLSIQIDMSTGLGLSVEESPYPDDIDPDDLYDASLDPDSIYYAAITDTNGTKYIVNEQENDKHTCDVPIDNTTYACADENDHLTYTFNRLVDTDEIASITINDTEYTRK